MPCKSEMLSLTLESWLRAAARWGAVVQMKARAHEYDGAVAAELRVIHCELQQAWIRGPLSDR